MCIILILLLFMSELFKGKEARISIFQDWNIVAPLMNFAKGLIPQKTKPQQIQRAQELLNYSELIHTNITSFLQIKSDLTLRGSSHNQNLERLLEQIYDLNNNKSKVVLEQDNIVDRMKEILRQLYRQLRTGRVIERHIGQFFQNANLSNYNPNIHQIRFSNNAQTLQILTSKIDQIKKTCRALFRGIHYDQQKLANVFGKDEGLLFCYSTLQELVSHDSMVRIHANMICQLKEVDDLKAQLAANNRAAEAEYSKYQLIYDCLELMKNQKEQIEREKQNLQENFAKAGRYVPVAQGFYPQKSRLGQEESIMRVSMGQGMDSQSHIEGNLKVYHTNLQNFTRVSAETSMYCYAYRQAQFVDALTKFQKFFQIWKRKHSHLAYLFEQRSILQDIRQQQTAKSTFSESNRQHLSSIYEQIRGRSLPQDLVIEVFRRNLLTDYEKELQGQRVKFSQREINKDDVKDVLVNQQKFFKDLKQVSTRQKIRYLRMNKQQIDRLIFQIQPLEHHSNRNQSYHSSVQLYSSALAFVKIISYNDDYRYQLDQFNDLMANGRNYRELPYGTTDFILAYVHDLNVVLSSHAEAESFGGRSMDKFLEEVQSALREKKSMKIDEAVEQKFYRISDYWLSLHSKFYRFLSPVGEELMLDELLELGQEIGRKIHQAVIRVTQIPEIVSRSMQIDRTFFYTYRVLLALIEMTLTREREEVEKFRIHNLDTVLEATFQYLDTFLLQKSPTAKTSDLIKLTLLQNFFNRVYKDEEYARLIRAVRLQVYLQFIGQVYVENYQNQNIRQNWLQPLLGIHFRMESIANLIAEVKEKKNSRRVYSLLESIRKYPLTFTHKHDVHGFQNALNVKEHMINLQDAMGSELKSISEAAQARITLQAIDEAQDLVQIDFDLHENVMIRTKKSVVVSFQDIRRSIENCTRDINQKEPLQRHFKDCKSSVTLHEGAKKLFRGSQ